MKNIVKAGLAGAVVAHAGVVSAIDVDRTRGNTSGDNGTGWNFIQTLDTILGYLIGLLYFVAIVFALYGGFQILILASSIVGWIIVNLEGGLVT